MNPAQVANRAGAPHRIFGAFHSKARSNFSPLLRRYRPKTYPFSPPSPSPSSSSPSPSPSPSLSRTPVTPVTPIGHRPDPSSPPCCGADLPFLAAVAVVLIPIPIPISIPVLDSLLLPVAALTCPFSPPSPLSLSPSPSPSPSLSRDSHRPDPGSPPCCGAESLTCPFSPPSPSSLSPSPSPSPSLSRDSHRTAAPPPPPPPSPSLIPLFPSSASPSATGPQSSPDSVIPLFPFPSLPSSASPAQPRRRRSPPGSPSQAEGLHSPGLIMF
ncbi:hypothetical protein ACLOJK_021305 [Asimina triloba]